MGLGDWITAAAAVIAAGASVLTYIRLRRQGETVGWRLEPGPSGHVLVRTGGGVARDVDVSFDEAAGALAWGELHHELVPPDATVRVATFMPASRDHNPGRVMVTWRQGRWGRRKRWHTYVT